MTDEIVQEIRIEGADAAASSVEKLGDVGEKAFQQVGAAAEEASEHVGAIAAAAKRAGVSYEEMADKVEKASAVTRENTQATEEAAKATEDHAQKKEQSAKSAQTLEQQIASLTSGLGGLGGTLGQLVGSLQSFIEKLVGAESAAAKMAVKIVEVIAGLAAFAQHAGQAAQALIHKSAALGLTTEQYERLKFVAEQTGTSMGSITRALRQVTNEIEKAAASGERSSGKFKKYGIDLVDAFGNAKEPIAVFNEVLEKAGNSANTAGILMDIFGKRVGGEFVQMALLGKDGIEKLNAEFERLGLTISQSSLEAGQKLNQSFALIGEVLDKFSQKLGNALAPGFTEMIHDIAVGIAMITPAAESAAKAIGGVLASAWRDLVGVGKMVTDVVRTLWDSLKDFSNDTGISGFLALIAEKFKEIADNAKGANAEGPKTFLGSIYENAARALEMVLKLAAALDELFGTKYRDAISEGLERAIAKMRELRNETEKAADAEKKRKGDGGDRQTDDHGNVGGSRGSRADKIQADYDKWRADQDRKAEQEQRELDRQRGGDEGRDADGVRRGSRGGGGGRRSSRGGGGSYDADGVYRGGDIGKADQDDQDANKRAAADDAYAKARNDEVRGLEKVIEALNKTAEAGEKSVAQAEANVVKTREAVERNLVNIAASGQDSVNAASLAGSEGTLSKDQAYQQSVERAQAAANEQYFSALRAGEDQIATAQDAVHQASIAAEKANAEAAKNAADQLDKLAIAADRARAQFDASHGQESAIRDQQRREAQFYDEDTKRREEKIGADYGYAGGGVVSGPGSSTSDSIPAYLSNGEYVVNAKAVSHYGEPFMHAVNAKKFADGGFVDSGLTKQEHGQFYGPVSVGDFTIPHALLDTGAANTTLPSKIAEMASLDMSNAKEGKRTTAGGETTSLTVTAPVNVGGVVRNVEVDVLEDVSLSLLGMNYMNALSDFAISKQRVLLQAASGGLVDGSAKKPRLRLAGGGLVSGMQNALGLALGGPAVSASPPVRGAASPSSLGTVHLTLDGQTHSMSADSDAFHSIRQTAVRRQLTSAGRAQRAIA